MYWLPATIRCTAASSASWPVTGGTGSRPAARIAEIAPAAVPSLAAPTPSTRRPNWVGWPSTHSRALSGLQSGVSYSASTGTPDWSPDKAREWVEGQLTQFGRRVIGVGAANDGTAAGAISAMRAAGLDPVPPVTGQDAELAAVQRIVAGNQYMTVYKAISQQARMAAELAVRLLRGELPVGTARVEGVPAVLLTPVAVTRDNVASVIVRGGVLTVEQICTPAYRQACLDIGLIEEGDT